MKNKIGYTIHLHCGTVSPDMRVTHLSSASGEFYSVDLGGYDAPCIFFDSLTEVRKFARAILEQCDEIDGPAVEPSIAPELVKAQYHVDPMAGELRLEKEPCHRVPNA